MPTCLIVTRAFPPKGGGGVQRMIKFVTYLKGHGWKTKVIAPSNTNWSWRDETPLEHIDKKTIIRIEDIQRSTSLLQRVVRRVQPVDAFMPWAKSVVHQCGKIDLKPDVVLSSGPPHSVHHAGMKLAQQFRAKWVVDFRDHFTLGPEYRPTSFIHRQLDKNFERKLLDDADALICNTKTNRREMIREHGVQYSKKLTTIYNGFDRLDLKFEETHQFDPDKVNYIYLGGLRGSKIDDTYFSALDHVRNTRPELADRIRVHVVGDFSRKGSLVDELVETGIIKLHEPVPANQIGALIDSADACLVWQRNRKGYKGTIAGKVFDYLAMKKPVFSIGQVGGEVERLIKRFGLGQNWSAALEPKELAQHMIQFHQRLLAGEFEFDELKNECLDRYSRQHQVTQLARLFDSLTHQAS